MGGGRRQAAVAAAGTRGAGTDGASRPATRISNLLPSQPSGGGRTKAAKRPAGTGCPFVQPVTVARNCGAPFHRSSAHRLTQTHGSSIGVIWERRTVPRRPLRCGWGRWQPCCLPWHHVKQVRSDLASLRTAGTRVAGWDALQDSSGGAASPRLRHRTRVARGRAQQDDPSFSTSQLPENSLGSTTLLSPARRSRHPAAGAACWRRRRAPRLNEPRSS